MSSHVVLIANPGATGASGRSLREVESILREAGFRVETHVTRGLGDAERMARKAAESGPRFVLVAGGDGTYNEAANGLAGTRVPMAILPAGHMNVLAREMGIPLNMAGAARAAVAGSPHPVTLGKVTLDGRKRWFCLMAGIGYDAATVARVRRGPKRLLRSTAYVAEGIGVLAAWRPATLRIVLDGREELEGSGLIVSNTSRYAGEFRVSPEAGLTDPRLETFVMHRGRRRDVIRYAWGIMTGRHLGFADVTVRSAESIEVRGAAHIQVDGDPLGRIPAVITAHPEALRLVW